LGYPWRRPTSPLLEESSIELRAARAAVALALAGAVPAIAQTIAPPRFAAPNLSPEGVRALAANCAPCHGTDGRPVPGSAVPPLAGRARAELRERLAALKAGREPSTVMGQIARGYSDAEIDALADYFSRLPR